MAGPARTAAVARAGIPVGCHSDHSGPALLGLRLRAVAGRWTGSRRGGALMAGNGHGHPTPKALLFVRPPPPWARGFVRRRRRRGGAIRARGALQALPGGSCTRSPCRCRPKRLVQRGLPRTRLRPSVRRPKTRLALGRQIDRALRPCVMAGPAQAGHETGADVPQKLAWPDIKPVNGAIGSRGTVR